MHPTAKQMQEEAEKGFQVIIDIADHYSKEQLEQKIENREFGLGDMEFEDAQLAIDLHRLRELFDHQTGIKDTFIKSINEIHTPIKNLVYEQDVSHDKKAYHAMTVFEPDEEFFNNSQFSQNKLSLWGNGAEWEISIESYVTPHELNDDEAKKLLNNELELTNILDNLHISSVERYIVDELNIQDDEKKQKVSLNQDLLQKLNNELNCQTGFVKAYLANTVEATISNQLGLEHLYSTRLNFVNVDVEETYKEEFPEQVKRITQSKQNINKPKVG